MLTVARACRRRAARAVRRGVADARHASSDFLPATPKAFLRLSTDRFRRIFDPSELFFFSPSLTDNFSSEGTMGSWLFIGERGGSGRFASAAGFFQLASVSHFELVLSHLR